MLHMAPPNWTEDDWRHFVVCFDSTSTPKKTQNVISPPQTGWMNACFPYTFQKLQKSSHFEEELKQKNNPMLFWFWWTIQTISRSRRHSLQNGSKWRLRNMWGPDLDRWNADTQFTKWQLENSTLFYTNIHFMSNIHFMLCFFDLFWPFWWIRTVLYLGAS